ncbi:MAG TPA: adenylate/guanylate cyclase domain-containing protein [Actinomycetota bacterium]|nr:adenylate/guanylate cyclase domain-containing protein [Actinomycetota bacterium]
MNCTTCGTENDASRKFCMECGSPLSRTCPSCGAPNPAPSKFCGDCGAAFGDAAPPDESTAGVAPETTAATERRLVSVLFLDLVSFTTLSETRDAEDIRSLMSAYFDTARTVIERHGGVVEKFIGDAVMAVWGTPVTHEDDAERAVRAALELVDAVAALGATEAAPLQARGGVLTGEAATSSDAANQGMVTGDMVNTASRLQSAADPGEVFVGEATYRAASRAIAFEEVGALTLKGKEEPVRAWRALRVVAERQGANRMTIEPPFVGRTEELRLLKELLHATGREGKVRVVSVTGIGGIGKSRLAWELLKYVDGLSDTIWWHQGRCPAYGDGVTFWALGEMVRMRAGIAETDPPGVSRTKLSASIAEHVVDEEERHWLEPRLAFLLGLDERPPGGREELFAAWRTFFERISDTNTVAMVFEDLQWADAGLLDFIESLLEWSRNRPILVLTLSRPELADRRPNWGAGQRNFVGLHLEPLPNEAVAELVRGLLPGAGEAALTRIVERAEGVPLYAVETIRMLADRGVLRAGEGAYELVGDLGELHVPETLHALIASRLDALGPEDRAMLQDATVLGKSFTLDALSAVTGADSASLEPRLLGLVRKEFLIREADPRSPERGQYGFVQSIIREVAYGMLSKADRRSRHLATAHHFEAADDDEIAGVVAAHYVEALRATPEGPDADALAARARDRLGQAAERATSLGSPEQALVFAEQALAITASSLERAELLEEAARAAGDALRPEERIAYLRQAVEVLREVGDLNAEVTMMGMLVDALGDLARVEQLRPLVDEMRQRLGEGGDDRARAELEYATATVLYFEGELEGCLAAVDRSAALFERAQALDRYQRAIIEKAYLLGLVGRRRESAMLNRGILAVATDEGDLRAMARASISLALQAEEMRDALERSLEGAAIARRGGYGGPEMTALSNAVEMAVECGAWDTADELLKDLRARAELPPRIADTVSIGAALLAAYRADGDAAIAAMDGLSEETTASEDPTMRAWHHRVLSVVSLMAGDLARAYDEAMAAIGADPQGPNSQIAVWAAGRAALAMGDAAKARGPLDRTSAPEDRSVAASRRAIEAGIAALEGHPREAAGAYDSVLAGRLALGDRFTHALVTIDAVTVLPEDLVPEGAVETARAYLEEIGAGALLARLTPTEVPALTER